MKSLLFAFIFLRILCIAQTQKADTIDYSKFAFLYTLVKVSQGKGQLLTELPGRQIWVSIVNMEYFESWNARSCSLAVRLNDTTITMDWDIEKEFPSEAMCYNHCEGKMSIQQKKNLMRIKKCRTDARNKQHIVDREFEIMKLTGTSLILKDVSSPKFNRIYYFKPFRPK